MNDEIVVFSNALPPALSVDGAVVNIINTNDYEIIDDTDRSEDLIKAFANRSLEILYCRYSSQARARVRRILKSYPEAALINSKKTLSFIGIVVNYCVTLGSTNMTLAELYYRKSFLIIEKYGIKNYHKLSVSLIRAAARNSYLINIIENISRLCEIMEIKEIIKLSNILLYLNDQKIQFNEIFNSIIKIFDNVELKLFFEFCFKAIEDDVDDAVKWFKIISDDPETGMRYFKKLLVAHSASEKEKSLRHYFEYYKFILGILKIIKPRYQLIVNQNNPINAIDQVIMEVAFELLCEYEKMLLESVFHNIMMMDLHLGMNYFLSEPQNLLEVIITSAPIIVRSSGENGFKTIVESVMDIQCPSLSAALMKNASAYINKYGVGGLNAILKFVALNGSNGFIMDEITVVYNEARAAGVTYIENTISLFTGLIGRISDCSLKNEKYLTKIFIKCKNIFMQHGVFNVEHILYCHDLLVSSGFNKIQTWLSLCGEAASAGGANCLNSFIAGIIEMIRVDPLEGKLFASGESADYLEFISSKNTVVKLSSVEKVLSNYIEGLLGRGKVIKVGDYPETDGEIIFLPSKITEFEDKNKNFTLYKVLATREEARFEYGSFEFDITEAAEFLAKLKAAYNMPKYDSKEDLVQFYTRFPEPETAEFIFNILEDYRVYQRVTGTYPVLGEQMSEMESHILKTNEGGSTCDEKSNALDRLVEVLFDGNLKTVVTPKTGEFLVDSYKMSQKLKDPLSSVYDSAEITAYIYASADEKFGAIFKTPVIKGIKAAKVLEQIGNFRRTARWLTQSVYESGGTRRQYSQQIIEKTLRKLNKRDGIKPKNIEELAQKMAVEEFQELMSKILSNSDESEAEGGCAGENSLREGAGNVADEIKKALADINLNDKLKKECLENTMENINENESDNFLDNYCDPDKKPAGKFYLYHEWDDESCRYIKDCVKVREISPCIKGVTSEFYNSALSAWSDTIKIVRSRFEKLKPSALKKQKASRHGEDIDINSAVNYLIDLKRNGTPSENIYESMDMNRRDIAVAILMDLSGSTRGKTIEFERISAVIMAEALSMIGDNFAIYGFDSFEEREANFHIVKDFNASVDENFKMAVGMLHPGAGTLMGGPIRHAIHRLNNQTQRTKLIMLISDGEPNRTKADPFVDTKMALNEAASSGIKVFCITVDPKAEEYLPEMYGKNRWVIVEEIEKLPEVISKIYYNITK